jgi:hypothetical protein
MKNGFKVFDTDTHVPPAAEVHPALVCRGTLKP